MKATVGGVSGTARVRVIPPLPWNDNFDSYAEKAPPPHWVNVVRKYSVQPLETAKVLIKKADIQHSFYTRARAFTGPRDLANYTTEADVMARMLRRSMGDIGGLCDATGRVLGLMPHPERHVLPTQHPRWTRLGLAAEGDGLAIFRNAVQFFQ